MKIIPLAIPDVLVLEPRVHRDNRGFFYESFNGRAFDAAIGKLVTFVQDSHSWSAKNVLRGLHYQIRQPQEKLVRVTAGVVFDVAVDLRKGSPTFGCWVSDILSAENKKQIWIPEGFAHGFAVMSHHAEVLYKTTDYWSPENERCIIWNDATLGIKWPIDGQPIISSKDARGATLQAAEVFD
ncbi:dTDP-4-dehydrorhamnose 3,5-epimerase [Petrachloros mirabilis]